MSDELLSLDLFDDPPASEPEVWSVSQVNRAVRNLLESELPPLWVSGEVANWKRASSGHRYFTLKDEQAQLRCVMWRADAERLPTDAEDGMEVRAFGGLTLYEARGEYQLVVRRLEAAGAEGLWRLAFEKLRRTLDTEGLLDPARKRVPPPFPRVVGVVTSTAGAALRDILSVLRRRAPWTRVLVMGTRVQGEGAGLEVARAIETLADSGRVDVLIVSRGGGSIEDLWAFNEEAVARAIVSSPVPVISGVGHEVDVTIADLVADLRAPTPSAAAEAAVRDGDTLRSGLERVPSRMRQAVRSAVDRRRSSVERGLPRLTRAMTARLAPRRSQVATGGARLARAIRVGIDAGRARLAGGAGRLEALSPLATLRRGYAVPLSYEGRVLRGVADFEAGRSFLLRVADGRVACETTDLITDEREP